MIVRVALEELESNPFQTRVGKPVVDELAASIRDLAGVRPETSGLIHVPVGRVVDGQGQVVDFEGDQVQLYAYLGREPEARVQLAAGHRRWAAFAQLFAVGEGREEFGTFPVDVVALVDQSMADIVQAENARREDVSPIEKALLIARSIEEFGWSQAQVGKRWGLTQGAVSNILRLLKLPELLRGYLNRGWISERHGRALLPLAMAGLRASKLAKLAQRKSGKPESADWFLSVADLETAIKLYVDHKTFKPKWELTWAPETPPGMEVGLCDECKELLRIGRKRRCGNAKRFMACDDAHLVQVRGPEKAKELYAKYTGWKRAPVRSHWQRCECCTRNGDRSGYEGDWYTGQYRWICPVCWQRAGLPELAVEVAGAQVGQALPVAGNGEETIPTRSPVMVPAVELEPVVPPRPPATVLTVRILPGDELERRPLLIGIAEEGCPPTLRRGWYSSLVELVEEVCGAHFGENGDISQEIVAEGVVVEGDASPSVVVV